MEWTVTVQSVESSKTKNGTDMYKVKILHDGESKYFNVFDAMQAKALMSVQESQEEIVLRMEEAGQWLNLDKIVSDVKTKEGTVIPKSVPKPRGGGFSGGKADPGKIKSIERQSALKQAVEYHAGSEVELEKVLETADKMLKWMSK